MATLTCHTEGCGNADIPIEVNLTYVDSETGETVTVGSAICGACGQPIDDVTGDEQSTTTKRKTRKAK